MIMDYHVHTEASPDAVGTIKDYVKKAVEKGIGEIGFSDHISLHAIGNYPHMDQRQMPAYIKNFLTLKQKAEVPIKLGAEIDFFLEDKNRIKEFIQKHPFDYIIGAVHFIGKWGIDNPRQKHEYLKRDILQTYMEYFSLIREMCNSRLFDVVAHLDLVKIFGFKPSCDFSDVLMETAEAIAKSKICVEINTAGLRRPCAEIYPSEEMLKILHAYDVPIVFGSDAHNPEDLCKNFKEALVLAKKTGYNYACVFSQRKKTLVEI
ncbi:MAG: histidinol-phosphatase HisJ family protein [Candidatus Bathyarchaeia archaeon]